MVVDLDVADAFKEGWWNLHQVSILAQNPGTMPSNSIIEPDGHHHMPAGA
jgi:hypothetical protein